jgi:hypothetical protein
MGVLAAVGQSTCPVVEVFVLKVFNYAVWTVKVSYLLRINSPEFLAQYTHRVEAPGHSQ